MTSSASERAGSEPPAPDRPIRVGVSACLLGQEVRYDAGHKREPFVADVLPRYVEMVPICPEVAIGMGVPREPIRLEGTPAAPRAVGVNARQLDVTDRLRAYGRETAARLEEISGYVFKSKSPSCGLQQVALYAANGQAGNTGTGIYAAEIRRAMPLLPVVEEGSLRDPALRESFVERVYAYRRWQDLLRAGITPERLASFHSAHELILLAHGRGYPARLRRLLDAAGERPVDALAGAYGELFMQALSQPAGRRRHADVLYHLADCLEWIIDRSDSAELVELIEAYRRGELPLIVPVTLLRHHFRRHPHPAAEQQLYLAWPVAGLSLWNAM